MSSPNPSTNMKSYLTVHSVPDPVHVLVSRHTFLSVAASEVIEYFQRSAIDFSADIWFDFNGIPLRSEFPVGVLYDLYLGRSKFKSPWKVVIHFQAYPRAVLIHKHVEVEKLFFHSMKQALFMLHGNARVFNDLSVENQQSIWRSVTTVNVTLQEPLFNTILKLPKDQVKLVPIRLVTLASSQSNNAALAIASPTPAAAPILPSSFSYGSISSIPSISTVGSSSSSRAVSDAATTAAAAGLIESHAPVYNVDQVLSFTQRPVKPLAATGVGSYHRDRTLREVLIEDFRQYGLYQAPSGAIGITVHPTATVTSGSKVQYTIQGMEMSLDLPIYELWCVMAHPDMFMYITVGNSSSS